MIWRCCRGRRTSFKSFAKIRDRSIRSGDSVVAIGFPFHGLLTSDFTVTTGIVSSLSGMLERFALPADQRRGAARQQRRPAVRHLGPDRRHGRRKDRHAERLPRAPAAFPKTSISRSRPARSATSSTIASSPMRPQPPAPSSRPSDIAGNARAYTLLISCTGDRAGATRSGRAGLHRTA